MGEESLVDFLSNSEINGSIFDAIEPIVSHFNTAYWVALDPNTVKTPYDPETDTGGQNGYRVLAMGDKPARIQQISLNRDRIGINNPTSEFYYRLSVVDEHTGGNGFSFPKDTLIRLTSVSRNERLLNYQFSVVGSVNSDFIQQCDVLLRVDIEDVPVWDESLVVE